MNRLSKWGWALAALLMVGCSSDDTQEPQPQTEALPTPEATITVGVSEATVRWSAVEHVMQYEWELQQDDRAAVSDLQRATSYTFKLEEGSTYKFRVRALARANTPYTDSEWSDYLYAMSNMLPAPQPTVDTGSLTATEATILWEAVEGAGGYKYELYDKAKELQQRGEVAETTLHLEGLHEGSSYTIQVMALARSEEYVDSSWSKPLYFETRSIEPLEAPEARITALAVTGATIAWEAVEGAVAYAYELVDQATEETVAASNETEELQVVFQELREQSSYSFRVKALSDKSDPYVADSDFSQPVSFTTRSSTGVDVGLPLAGETDGVVRAFPGAEGGGMYTTGGRGGKVYHVTTLEDTGNEGSLRWAVNQSGPRTIVFDVSGTIRLKSTLSIKKGDLTIAGQTAPGDGICLRDYAVQLNANNVIIRYMRFRMGDEAKQENDAIWGRYYSDIILDHCSMSWSTDECASFYANCNFTMQWCLVGESLKNSVHGKGSHGYGGIWGGRNASFHHNMLTCHDSRNCRIDHPQIYDNYVETHRGHVDIRNNVIYNWGSNVTYGGEAGWFNLVGNYYKPGPASKDISVFVNLDAYYEKSGVVYAEAYPDLYVEGNVHTKYPEIESNNRKGVKWTDGNYANYQTLLSSPLSILCDDQTLCYTTTHSAADAFSRVANYAGASLSRDEVDRRLVNDALTGTATITNGGNGSKSGIIDTQDAVGGWPELTATDEEQIRASVDGDGDGIPDYYESLLGLDATNSSDGNAKTLDPQGLYTNLEVYLHYLVKDITAAQVNGGAYTPMN